MTSKEQVIKDFNKLVEVYFDVNTPKTSKKPTKLLNLTVKFNYRTDEYSPEELIDPALYLIRGKVSNKYEGELSKVTSKPTIEMSDKCISIDLLVRVEGETELIEKDIVHHSGML